MISNLNLKKLKGFSLVEILVVIAIFAVLAVLSTRSLFLTIRSARKSDSLVKVRENVNYSLSIIERQIRNAQLIDCVTSSSSILNYKSLEGLETSFSCASNYIASGSARLTSSDVLITSCTFSCTQGNLNSPPLVKVSITAEDAVTTSVEKGRITSETEIVARNY